MPAPPVAIGDVVAGKYLIEGVLGEGGMGVVMAARHQELDQRIAIKFLLAEVATLGNAAERFRREARSAARIRSDHVCRVLDVGALPNGVPYLVMELLEGCDLSTELEQRGHLPLAEAIEHILQACEGLAEAHSVGVIHRDLKPANLFLAARTDGSRRVKILDFGVSKLLTDSGEGVNHALTQTSALVGSPLYMSPEQLSSSKDVDARADVWALGALLYELLSGRPPFNGDNVPQLVHRVMHEEPASLEAMDPTLPRGIDEAVMRALRKQRDDRYPSVAELANALAPFAPRHALLSVSRVSRLLASRDRGPSAMGGSDQAKTPADGERVSGGPSTPMTWSAAKRETRRRVGIGLTLFTLCVVVGLLYLLRARTDEVASPQPEVTEPAPHVVMPAPVQPPVQAQAATAQPAPALDAGVPSIPSEAAPSEAAVIEPQPAPEQAAARERSSRKRTEAPPAAVVERLRASAPPSAQPVAPSAPKPPSGVSDFGGRR